MWRMVIEDVAYAGQDRPKIVVDIVEEVEATQGIKFYESARSHFHAAWTHLLWALIDFEFLSGSVSKRASITLPMHHLS